MADLILAVVLLVVVGGAIAYIRKEKKRGVRCIGCPSAGVCSQKHDAASGCGGGCGCGSHTDPT